MSVMIEDEKRKSK